ncbi:MAG TPA: right-handed parallel beta-helix repeat-containing protein [Saprospiraceae bacterium]|nr:right-handed parallel beta-helix repeat-containing protein [Saprospiraceae bacterium]
MHARLTWSWLSFFFLFQNAFAQNILNVGPGRTYANPAQAAAAARPGDTILIHPSTYTGSFYIENLKGTASAWITVRGTNRDQVIFRGGSQSMHFTDAQYVRISDLTITQQTGNGMNIDDGGTPATPAKRVIVENCIFRDMAATGNNDQLKLSGLDSFVIANCRFENGATGGSGIDMVGCHAGILRNNYFFNQGSNSIQAKGGSSQLHITGNEFRNGGQRAVNLGGSTGLAFFRPMNANYEAKDLLVTANLFDGGITPVAFVGCRNVRVINNTIIRPQNWIFRILQESSDTSFFVSCANNSFSNNIVVVSNSLRADVNIGPNTLPGTFTFANNLWFHLDNAGWRGPQLPVMESNGIIQQNPLFKNFNGRDFSLMNNSPAIGKGKYFPDVLFDYAGKAYLQPPAIGAYESDLIIANEDPSTFAHSGFFPNPANEFIQIAEPSLYTRIGVYTLEGRCVKVVKDLKENGRIRISELPVGIYLICLESDSGAQVERMVKL